MKLFQEPKLCRDVYVERRWHGLSFANPLQSFELRSTSYQSKAHCSPTFHVRNAND